MSPIDPQGSIGGMNSSTVENRESHGVPPRNCAVRHDPASASAPGVPDLASVPFPEEIKRSRVSTARLMEKLTESQEQYVKEQVDQVLERFQLEWTPEATSLFGTRSLADNSINKYQTHYRGMELFLKRIGD